MSLRGLQHLTGTCLLALALAAAPSRGADDWSAIHEALARLPGQERTAFDFLQRLPLATRTTAPFHVALARAARAVENQLWASRSLMVLEVFLKPQPPPALDDVKKWLAGRGLEHHRRAREAMAKGDERTAVREYLTAVRCDHAVMGFDERHLREVSYLAMDKLVRAHATDPEYWGHMAFYSYYFGHLDETRDALRRALALQQDPYMRWIYEQGLRVCAEDAARPKASPSPAAAAQAALDPIARSYREERRVQDQQELARVQRLLGELAPGKARKEPAAPAGGGRETIQGLRRLKEYVESDLKAVIYSTPSIGVSY